MRVLENKQVVSIYRKSMTSFIKILVANGARAETQNTIIWHYICNIYFVLEQLVMTSKT